MKQEIENKLREIGYTGKTDLETILEALPKVIRNNEIFNLRKNEIGYYFLDYQGEVCLIGVDKEDNESLADTAARLLIALAEQKIINFK